MGLMARDIELADAKREVDGVEVFERRRKVIEVKREKDEGDDNAARLIGSRSSSGRSLEREAFRLR
jgi:hypothetical protein